MSQPKVQRYTGEMGLPRIKCNDRVIEYWKDREWKAWVALELNSEGHELEDGIKPSTLNASTKVGIEALILQELLHK